MGVAGGSAKEGAARGSVAANKQAAMGSIFTLILQGSTAGRPEVRKPGESK